MGRGGERERRWFVLKRPRCDTNEESETEVTVTSKLHAKQKEQRNRKEKRRQRDDGSECTRETKVCMGGRRFVLNLYRGEVGLY